MDENHLKNYINQGGDDNTNNSSTRASWMSKLSLDAKTTDSMYDTFIEPQTKTRKFSKFKIYESEEQNTIGEVIKQEERLHIMIKLLVQRDKEPS